MSSEFYSNVLLISSRQDVIVYCKRNLPDAFQLTVIRDLSNYNLNLYQIVLYDVSSAASDYKKLFSDIESKLIPKLRKVAFIIPSIVCADVRNKIFSLTKNIIPYPCNSRIYKNIINYIAFINKDENNSINNRFYIYGDISEEEKIIKEVILGESAAMKSVREKIICYSKNDNPVLLLGESGTGKTTSAEYLHRFSSRSKKPYIPISTINIGINFADTSLFGTVDGAFTDAKVTKGFVQKADGGTLFIDEIGLADLDIQSKFYMLLDSGVIYSVGSSTPQKIDTRLIFATNDNLEEKMKKGLFRKELYYRIFANVIYFPPLREHRGDIALIAQNLAEKNNKYFSPTALRKLEEYSWPGNVRQLENCVNRAVASNKNEQITEDNIFFGI